MRKTLTLVAITIAACVAPSSASAVVLNTKWVEKTELSVGGSYTIYVRKIEITKTTWRAWVGLVNKSKAPMNIVYGAQKNGPTTTFWPGPGIWYSGVLAPGSAVTTHRHVDATSVLPALPHVLRVGRSWFGSIQGSSAKLPKDRLLRIGFGWLEHPYAYPTEISTTHQFKLRRQA